MNYILHRVNHSVWFGKGNFHTNTIEGLWATVKRISHHFSGLNFNILKEIENDGICIQDYIDGSVCYCLLMRDIERKKLNEEQSLNMLFTILKI